MYEQKYTQFNNLVGIIDALAESRAAEFKISFEEMNLLDKILLDVSIYGEMPKDISPAPKEDNPSNKLFMCLEGKTHQSETDSTHTASIQWGSEGNSNYIHLEFLGFNFLVLKSQSTVFSHDKHRNLADREIGNIVKMIKKTSWGYPEFKTMDQILSLKNSNDLS